MFNSIKANNAPIANTKPLNHKIKRRQVEIDALRKKQFFAAAKYGETQKFRWYLEQDYNIDTIENESRRDTALIAACRLGRTDIVQIALEFDAKNDPHPEFGQTALQVAVSSGHKSCVSLLLETAAVSEADHIIVNHEDSSKEAPLHVASRCGNLAILELLMKHGANILSVDTNGRTCLHCAVQSGRRSCLEYLLQVGGDQIIEERNDQGLTCLHVAIKLGNLSCAESLLQGGADTRSITPDGLDVLTLAKSRKSRKLIDLVLQYESVVQSPSKNWNGEDLFLGLDVFQSPVQSESNAGIPIDVQVDGSQSLSPITYCTGAKIYDVLERDMQTESFYFSNQLWFTFFHRVNGCSHPYFSRAFDNHSQWEDPRFSGIIEAVSHPSNDQMNSPSEQFQSSADVTCVHPDTDDHAQYKLEDSVQSAVLSLGTEKCESKLVDINGTTGEMTVKHKVPINKPTKLQHVPIDNFFCVSSEPCTGNRERRQNPTMKTTTPAKDAGDDTSSDFENTMKSIGAEAQNQEYQTLQLPPLAPKKSAESKPPKACGNFDNHTACLGKVENDENTKIGRTPCKEEKEQSNNLYLDQKVKIGNSKYNRMLAVGVPLSSIAHKMISDGIATCEIDSFEKENSSKSSCKAAEVAIKNILSDDSKFKKYTKMLSIRIPLEAVMHKMINDGLGKDDIKIFKVANGDKGDRESSTKECGKPQIQDATKIINKDSSLTKYKKMLSFRIPAQSVVNKMRQDGVTIATIHAFEIEHGIVKTPTRTPLRQLNLPCPPVLLAPKRRTSVAMQKIHWNPVSPKRLQHSLWAIDNDSKIAIDDLEVKELENLFAKKTATNQPKRYNNRNKKTEERVSLIDTKRSYNIAISLTQFKSFQTYDELCLAVVSFDASKLNSEQLQNMTTLLPSQGEIKKLREYKGSETNLGRAEKFLLAISRIPRFSQKLHAFTFVLQFTEITSALRQSLINLDNACQDIVNSKKLANIMKRLLAVGNLVNEGAGNPKAAGITLDSLLKTATKTGIDGKTKVIDVVVANFMKQDKDGYSIEFWTELKSVNIACRIDLRDCKTSLREIQNGILKVKQVSKIEGRSTEASYNTEICIVDTPIFVERCEDFLSTASDVFSKLDVALESTEVEYNKLCLFFAEDPSICKAPSIFEVIMNFSQIVLKSKESWLRRTHAAKRRDKMDTPNKISSKLSLKQSLLKNRFQIGKSVSSTTSMPNGCKDEIRTGLD